MNDEKRNIDALFRASYIDDAKTAEKLLAEGVDANSRDEYEGDTILISWITEGFISTEFPKVLIENGADVNKTDEFGNTPLDIANWYENKDLIELLLKHKAVTGLANPDIRLGPIMPDDLGSLFRIGSSVRRN